MTRDSIRHTARRWTPSAVAGGAPFALAAVMPGMPWWAMITLSIIAMSLSTLLTLGLPVLQELLRHSRDTKRESNLHREVMAVMRKASTHGLADAATVVHEIRSSTAPPEAQPPKDP